MSHPRRPFRLATYNVEWFNALFDDTGRPLEDSEPAHRYGVTRGDQLAALGIVFTALDADGIMVIEAPDTNGHRSSTRALERFAALYGLRARRAVTGFKSETEQEISFLFDPDRLTARHDPQGNPTFDGTFRRDLDGDGVAEPIRPSKPPLELAVTVGRHRLRLIGVHVKSKAPHGARHLDEARRIAIENRRKQLAECIWLRERVDEHLDRHDDLIVLGDFNDGPGLDEYEKLFGTSGVEVVMGVGCPRDRQLRDLHAQMAVESRLHPTTARFYSTEHERYFEALLDFIMVSPGLTARQPHWRIWHPLNDPKCWAVPELRDALLTASDHFPVTLDLPL
ncbi:MAG: endonuclease [Rhodobacterales bacterium 65-51]|uniref:endonuclease/exonuclease/phosphatase family protein n=1 Tax=uncultured Gemmobacter sp. TaxID=1095917 RepID=UPI000966741C|nr:endonuclease/exonuclease/phosphatase family protein [uncultured Gemmobacter sp.]OJY27505.1 MAG: endonuclease [Rhodobacterales bacterium 65-51]